MEGLVQMVGTHLGSSYVVWPGMSMEYELQGGNVEVKQECLGPGTRSGQKLAKHLLAETWFYVAKAVAGSSHPRLK